MSSASSAAFPTSHSIPTSQTWLARVQQRFLEGRNCDVILRVSVEHPKAGPLQTDSGAIGCEAKLQEGQQRQQQPQQQQEQQEPQQEQQQEQEQEQEQEQQQQQQQQQHTVDIPCHSVILSSRSRYFDAALCGPYVENQQKTVELQLADEQAVDDLRLLIKLSCGLSYVQDGNMRLLKAMRLPLAFLANALEFVECVQELQEQECLHSLSEENLTWEDAFTLLDDMPDELWEHEANIPNMHRMSTNFLEEIDRQAKRVLEGDTNPEDEAASAMVKYKITKALISIIETLSPQEMQGLTTTDKKKEAMQLAGEALCKALGRVNEFFLEGATKPGRPHCSTSNFYKVLKLRDDIKMLSPVVMKIILASESLQLQSENDAYYLLCAWLSQLQCIPDEAERQTVFKRLLPQLRFHHMSHDFLGAIVSACPYASASDLIPYMMRCSHTLTKGKGVKLGSKNRGKGHPEYTFKGKYKLEELSRLGELPPNALCISMFLGLAAGFPVAVYVKHDAKGVGIYLHVGVPPWQGFDTEYYGGHCVGFVSSIKVEEVGFKDKYFFQETNTPGRRNFFNKKWEEVVFPNSPYFPNDELMLEVTMETGIGGLV